MTPYSTGTWGSRCMVMAGGAVVDAPARRSRERATRSARSCCRPMPSDVSLRGGEVVRPDQAASASREIARTWYRRPQDLPPDVDPGGLEVDGRLQAGSATPAPSAMPRMPRGRGRSRDRRCRDPRLRHRRGRRHAGQSDDRRRPDLWRPGAGHRHRALRGDAVRRVGPAAGLDASPTICCPGPTEVPAPRLDHMETLAPYTEFGVKGIGEGGAIAPPAAIANAVNDALRPLGARAAAFADHAAPRPRGDAAQRASAGARR